MKLEGFPVTVAFGAWRWGYEKFADSERLRRGLRQAGLPELPYAWLTADQLRALLFGHSLHGRSPGSGAEHAASFTTDGVVTMSGDWGAQSGGVARIEGGGEGGQVCIEPRPAAGSCASVYTNPGGTTTGENEFIWLDASGTYPFSRVR